MYTSKVHTRNSPRPEVKKVKYIKDPDHFTYLIERYLRTDEPSYDIDHDTLLKFIKTYFEPAIEPCESLKPKPILKYGIQADRARHNSTSAQQRFFNIYRAKRRMQSTLSPAAYDIRRWPNHIPPRYMPMAPPPPIDAWELDEVPFLERFLWYQPPRTRRYTKVAFDDLPADLLIMEQQHHHRLPSVGGQSVMSTQKLRRSKESIFDDDSANQAMMQADYLRNYRKIASVWSPPHVAVSDGGLRQRQSLSRRPSYMEHKKHSTTSTHSNH